MDKTLKVSIKKYFREIKKELPCSSNTKSAFIAIFKKRIYEFLEDNPTATFDDIIIEFGTPVSVISGFDPDEYGDVLKKKEKQFVIFKICTLVLIIALLVTGFILYKSIEDNNIYIYNEY